MIDNTDEKDIELMFAEARRYDLLTAEQEQSIDSTKWSAVREIYALIAENDELSQYLAQFCRECLENPPQIQRFPNRDLHFVLRRELAALFSDGSHADQSRNVAKKLSELKTSAARLKHVESLELPASLTIGIAVAILRRAGGQFADTVADAIGHWQRHWQTPVPSFALDHSAVRSQETIAHIHRGSRSPGYAQSSTRLFNRLPLKGRGVGYLDLVQEGRWD